MYRTQNLTIALTIALALSACSETPVGPGTTSVSALGGGPSFAKSVSGTGLVLDNVTARGTAMTDRATSVITVVRRTVSEPIPLPNKPDAGLQP